MTAKGIVFLDVDGVLNHRDSFGPGMPSGNKRFAPECVERLNRLIDATGADIVVSSTWRSDPDIVQVLKNAGVAGTVIGITPQLRDIGKDERNIVLPIPRGVEIDVWLHWHGNERPFVILDDDSDMASLSWALVQTRFDGGGLLDEHVDRAIELLATPSPSAGRS